MGKPVHTKEFKLGAAKMVVEQGRRVKSATIISQGPWSHDGVVLGILILIFLEVNPKPLSNKLRVAIYGALLGWCFACRINAVSIIVPFGFYLLFRRGVLFAAGAAAIALVVYSPLAYYFHEIYGTPWGPQYLMRGSAPGPIEPLKALVGILISPAHGLSIYQPWLMLLALYVLPVTRKSLTDKMGKYLSGFLVSASVLHVAIVSQWWCWWGGTWGSRLMSEIIPLLALLVLFPVEYLRARFSKSAAKLFVGLALVSFLFHLPHLFLFAGQWAYNPLVGDSEGDERVWDWKSPPFLYPILKKIRPLRTPQVILEKGTG